MRFRTKNKEDIIAKKIGTLYYRVNSQPDNWYKVADYIASSSNRPLYNLYQSCSDELHPGPPFKTGGGFRLVRSHYPYNYEGGDVVHKSTYYKSMGSLPSDRLYKYEGGFSLYLTPASYVIPVGYDLTDHSNDGDVSSYGAEAWNRFKPLKPRVGLAQTIAELKDIPSMLQQTSRHLKDVWQSLGGKRHLRNTKKIVADEFLANQFGWLPFISDLRKFYTQFKRLEKDAKRMKDQNNKWIRRCGSVAVESSDISSATGSVSGHSPRTMSPMIPTSGSGDYSIRRYMTKNVSFVAMFKYYVPELNTPQWRDFAIRRLFGLQITPTLIYELTPWSWLADWFSNIGDVISNIEDNLLYNLVAKYAYLMGDFQYNTDITSNLNFNSLRLTHTWKHTVQFKTRTGCNPYSFSWDASALSNYQAAILSALGVSRLR